MKQAVILLGTNLNDRPANLKQAREQIAYQIGEIIQVSSIYRTAPWGNTDQDDFLNQIVVVETTMEAVELLSVLLQIEKEMGRVRTKKWAPRLIDLDILYYDSDIISNQELKVPHPYLQDRRFTLIPLAEIQPDYVHPVLGLTNSDLLAQCSDHSDVFIYEH
jgi:2-amino-4-hydroxy-6-hydroxymethyldihydropteridine diphosphokinase